ncbi:MAG: hypothetical protein KOO66_10500 [Bacteroidales bacterium]|nr:hypothetical protein [Bacteroidales bacterium]
MKNYINYVILKDKKLIFEYYYGEIYLNDFIDIHERKSNDKDFNANYNLLIDFRDAEIHLSKKDVLDLVQFHKNSPKLYGSRYAAHITKTPEQVVAGTMFDILNNELPIKIKVFSTLVASLDWVGLSIEDKNIIESYIDQFKKAV